MSKRTIKGWIPPSITENDILWWDSVGFLTEEGVISNRKGFWNKLEPPPRRITITIEAED